MQFILNESMNKAGKFADVSRCAAMRTIIVFLEYMHNKKVEKKQAVLGTFNILKDLLTEVDNGEIMYTSFDVSVLTCFF